MAFRFVHAADIHLDSPLRSLALRNPDLAGLIGNATRRAFEMVVRLCLDEHVDALLLSGDLYDGDQTSMKTARFLADQIRLLHQADIDVFVIRGNHDHLSRITKELTFPDSVTIFRGRLAGAIQVKRAPGEFPVTIHGISFAQAQAPESLLASYRPPTEGAINIGLMHTSLDGSPGHDLYAPCSLADLQRSEFSYWALGHIHARAASPGAVTVVMPGMPQGRDINEAGPKSVTLVTVADDRSVVLEERLTSVAQFERVRVDLSGIAEWQDMVVAVGRALGAARDKVVSEHLVARVHLTGTTPLAWRLRRDFDLLATQMDAHASVIGKSWIDKVEIECQAPGLPADPGAGGDPLLELRRLMQSEVLGSEGYQGEIEAIARELQAQLPADCRDLLGKDETAFATRLAEMAREGVEDVLARLRVGAGQAG